MKCGSPVIGSYVRFSMSLQVQFFFSYSRGREYIRVESQFYDNFTPKGYKYS